MAEIEVGYLYLGNELGGYRRGGYQSFVMSEEFQKGIGLLEGMALESRVVILCAERLPWRCHRRFIGEELSKRGWLVNHIIDQGRSWVPRGLRNSPPSER